MTHFGSALILALATASYTPLYAADGMGASASDKPNVQEAPPPHPARRYALGYFLPKTAARAKFAQRIVKCPSPEDPKIEVISSVEIAGVSIPDPTHFVEIDARAGFLAERSTDLKLNGDGTISAINATVEGQGAAVLVSLAKTASTIVPLATGAGFRAGRPTRQAPPLTLECVDAVKATLARRTTVGNEVEKLETKLREKGLSTLEQDLLEVRRTEFAALNDALTLTSKAAVKVVSGTMSGSNRIAPVKYETWFTDPKHPSVLALPGAKGLGVSWEVDEDVYKAFKATGLGTLPKTPKPTLYYRRPVPVDISTAACAKLDGPCDEGINVDQRAATAALFDSATIGFLQLSGLFELSIGRGGLFGSREINAEFDESGAPVRLQYGSSPGAADVASVIDAGSAAAESMRGAKQAALERRVAILKLRKEISELEAEAAKPDGQ